MKKITVAIMMLVMMMAGCGFIPSKGSEPQPVIVESDTEAPKEQKIEEAYAEEAEAEEGEAEKVEFEDAGEQVAEVDINRWYVDFEYEGDDTIVYLAHQTGPDDEKDVEKVYVFDDPRIDGYYCRIYDYNEEENFFLFYQEGSFYTFDLTTKELKEIASSCLDKRYDAENHMLYYVDVDHVEYSVDWLNKEEPIGTGNTVIRYFEDSFEPEINEEFNDRFHEIQDQMKAGADRSEFTDVKIYYNGDIYNLNGMYISNVHLPECYKWNSNVLFDESDMEITMIGNKLTYWHFGEVVREYTLPEGHWRVIQSYLRYHEDPNEWSVQYVIDVNKDGIVTAEEMNAAVTNTNILLYNFEDNSVWTINQNGWIVQVCEGCIDFQEAYGEFYWMDYQFNAYELSWTEDQDSILIGEDVVAISHHTDERAGFVVKPGDTRANHKSDGLDLCTLYGTEWLNQEQTSGAWAIDYDWEKED